MMWRVSNRVGKELPTLRLLNNHNNYGNQELGAQIEKLTLQLTYSQEIIMQKDNEIAA